MDSNRFDCPMAGAYNTRHIDVLRSCEPFRNRVTVQKDLTDLCAAVNNDASRMFCGTLPAFTVSFEHKDTSLVPPVTFEPPGQEVWGF